MKRPIFLIFLLLGGVCTVILLVVMTWIDWTMLVGRMVVITSGGGKEEEESAWRRWLYHRWLEAHLGAPSYASVVHDYDEQHHALVDAVDDATMMGPWTSRWRFDECDQYFAMVRLAPAKCDERTTMAKLELLEGSSLLMDAAQLPEFAVASRQIQRVRENLCRNKEAIDRRLENLSSSGGGRKAVHLSFVTSSYSLIALNWIASLERLGMEDYLLVCLDSESCSFITANTNKSSCVVKYDDATEDVALAELWLVRWMYLYHLLDRGVDVVLSDVDAVWLRSPPRLAMEFDIVASQGTFPSDVYLKWGTTLCVGLVYFRSSDRVLHIVSKVVWDIAMATKDDQISLNHVLHRLQFQPQDISSFRKLRLRGGGGGAGQPQQEQLLHGIQKWGVTMSGPFVLVGLLSRQLVPRDCDADADADADVPASVPPLAMHCLTPKAAAAKMQDLQRRHLWFL